MMKNYKLLYSFSSKNDFLLKKKGDKNPLNEKIFFNTIGV